MNTWDATIFNADVNEDFLTELSNLEDDDIVEAVRDAVLLAVRDDAATPDDHLNGLAAATIAAIWAGAPFSAGEVAENHPFLRELVGSGDEQLSEAALELLENEETELDLEQFIEALS